MTATVSRPPKWWGVIVFVFVGLHFVFVFGHICLMEFEFVFDTHKTNVLVFVFVYDETNSSQSWSYVPLCASCILKTWSLKVPFHNDFPLAVSSLNNTNQLIHYNNQLTVVEQCFTNIAAIQDMELL